MNGFVLDPASWATIVPVADVRLGASCPESTTLPQDGAGAGPADTLTLVVVAVVALGAAAAASAIPARASARVAPALAED